jgi:hypothetical protein
LANCQGTIFFSEIETKKKMISLKMIQRKEDLLLSIFLLAFLALILTETKRPVEKANTEAAKNHHVKGDTF